MNLMNEKIVISYIKTIFGGDISDQSDKNYLFDIKAGDITIEVKEREFDRYNHDFYIQDDLLFEYIQTKKGMKESDPMSIFKSIGWLYKTDADYLLYFKYFEHREVTIYKIKWKPFKAWLLSPNIMEKYNERTVHSRKTTDSWNIAIKYSDIPDDLKDKKVVRMNHYK